MLSVRGLTKRYGEVVALDDCSFDVRAGRITGFLGPNGAGKTTTMRAVFGLVAPDAGTIRWQGEPVDRRARRRFGYMPEERGLYPKMKVREQVAHFGFVAGMQRDDADRAAAAWLRRLGLADREHATVDELSHGNQQRVQLAVALVHDPQLLVLDEPFAGLDPLAVDDLGAMVRDLAADGRTVLFSSHQLDLVEDLCEDVVTIDRGRVVLAGDVARLRDESQRWHLTLEVTGAPEGWVGQLPDAEPVVATDGHVEVLVGRDVDLPAIVERAARMGEIRRLDYDPPTLSQLFREAVRR
jgi:ABC-2 type transport system ATP-binding protein